MYCGVEPASARIIFELDLGERDADRVFDGEGLAALADAQRRLGRACLPALLYSL
jgi:hypothetical protein